MLALPDHWLWDFWLADDGDIHHLFFLKAPKRIGDPKLRHRNVRIGHAVSDDLVAWEVLDDAMAPSPHPALDDSSTWTGSVVRGPDGTWRMFYTGTRTADDGLVQRVLMATSDDLSTWTRDPSVVVEADAAAYERLGAGDWHDEAWRDPWVEPDPSGHGWRMLVTARSAHGPDAERGVIGQAWSPDLQSWEVRPPLSSPGAGFGQLEVPQLEEVDGRWLLVFSCPGQFLSPAGRERHGSDVGTWAVWVDDPSGPWPVDAARPITGADAYSGRVVRGRDGAWQLLTFRDIVDGGFVGVVNDPVPLADLTIPAPR